MKDKDRNPHQQKFQDANNKFLGTYSSGNEGRNRFAKIGMMNINLTLLVGNIVEIDKFHAVSKNMTR